MREIPERLRPQPAPIFPDGNPSPRDIELPRALFLELDAESQNWYVRESTLFEPVPVPAKRKGKLCRNYRV